MSSLFDDYENLEQEVYKRFKFDLSGCGDEIKVIAFLVYIAQEKAFAAELSKMEEISNKMEAHSAKFEEINTSLNRSLMSTLKLFADLFDNKFNEISLLKEEIHSELSTVLKNEVNTMASIALKQALSVNGISLNNELKGVVSTLNESAENSIAQASALSQKVNKSLTGIKIKLFTLPLFGSFVGIVIMLLMISAGIVSIPVNVNIDVMTLANEIMNNIR